MTLLQRIYKSLYPFAMSVSPQKKHERPESIYSTASFYDLESTLSNGGWFDFSKLKNKKVLIVNTASDCIYTPQFKDLQTLHYNYQQSLIILGFPSNDFFNQDKKDDNFIAAFCLENYGTQFSIMKKSIVIKKEGQNPVYEWLTDSSKNGWNNKAPEWNFSKYLVNEKGELTHYFSPGISPLSQEFYNALQQ